VASNEPLSIFISYARNDDQPPLEGEGRGFVTTLVKYVEARLVELGKPPVAEVWRDQRAIVPSDQFGPVIEAGIKAADVLLVILSNNWMNSEWCNKELEFFGERFAGEPTLAKQRIVVVNKRYVPVGERPAFLSGQEGYKFFRPDKDSPGGYYEYFALGKSRLPEFQNVVEALALDLWGRARTKANMSPLAVVNSQDSTPGPKRNIFVARPAPDMTSQFDRVVQELQNRDYTVLPYAHEQIPQDASALAFFDDALTKAEVAIHLLGEKSGFIPDENMAPIAKLQLERSARRVTPSSSFRRLIWAPAAMNGSQRRDPLEVLRRFAEKAESDKVDGSDLSTFVDFIVKHLHDNAPVAGLQTLPTDARVYIYHQKEDTQYAMTIAKALRERELGTVFPIFQGDPSALRSWHEKQLKTCDAVLLCWANADEAFTFSMIDEWGDWRTLGRKSSFSSRAVAVGPPRNERKEALIEFPPRPDVDIVIDLTSTDKPGPEELGLFLNAAR
jgi:hypothetical protein